MDRCSLELCDIKCWVNLQHIFQRDYIGCHFHLVLFHVWAFSRVGYFPTWDLQINDVLYLHVFSSLWY